MKTDYPELEGKKVKYFYDAEIYITGTVSGCNYHIGITIQNKYHYLVCLNGKSSPIYKDIIITLPRHVYRKVFHLLVKQIQNGKVIASELDAFLPKYYSPISTKRPNAKNCPYAQ